MELQSSLEIHKELEKTVECERESWKREQKQLEEHVAQLEVTLEQTTMELQSSLKIHEELEKTVECERESWAREQKKVEEHVAQLEVSLDQTTMELQSFLKIHRETDKTVECERENKNKTREQKQLKEHVAQLEVTLEQMTKELQPSLKTHEELEKAVECERESWEREQKQLLERVAQLEANLEFERNKWEEKSKKDQLDMRERNNLQLQTFREVQDTLNLCKEERKTAKHEKDNLMRHQERLEERVSQLQATLDFEKNIWEVKIKMAKQDMQEKTILQLQTIRDLQDSLNQCEEEKNCAENERDNLMREREQQEEHVAQLKATLEFERNKWKEKRKKAELDMEKNKTLQLQTIRELQDSLNHCEEEKNRAEHERDNLIREREKQEDHVAQLKATLNFERNKWDEEKKKVELDMVWSSNMFLTSIRELQDTVNHCKIQMKSN